MADTARRRIPEATVARLPLYYRALLESAEHDVGTISSERLAELAGVNAAKVRKDLSYLGSYGTRGVGYDVDYLLHEISASSVSPGLAGRDRRDREPRAGTRELPRVRRARLSDRGARRRRPAARGQRRRRPHDRAHRVAREHRRRTQDRDRHDRHAGAGRAGGGRSPGRCGRAFDPELRAGGADGAQERLDAQGRPRDRAPDPVLLPTAAGWRLRRPDRPSERVDARLFRAPGEPPRARPARGRGRRGPDRGAQDRTAPRPRRRGPRDRARSGRGGAGLGRTGSLLARGA